MTLTHSESQKQGSERQSTIYMLQSSQLPTWWCKPSRLFTFSRCIFRLRHLLGLISNGIALTGSYIDRDFSSSFCYNLRLVNGSMGYINSSGPTMLGQGCRTVFEDGQVIGVESPDIINYAWRPVDVYIPSTGQHTVTIAIANFCSSATTRHITGGPTSLKDRTVLIFGLPPHERLSCILSQILVNPTSPILDLSKKNTESWPTHSPVPCKGDCRFGSGWLVGTRRFVGSHTNLGNWQEVQKFNIKW
jgi:hypothetical protein